MKQQPLLFMSQLGKFGLSLRKKKGDFDLSIDRRDLNIALNTERPFFSRFLGWKIESKGFNKL